MVLIKTKIGKSFGVFQCMIFKGLVPHVTACFKAVKGHHLLGDEGSQTWELNEFILRVERAQVSRNKGTPLLTG